MSYQILYHPGFTGRAEPAILLLEDAQVPYEIVNDVHERIRELAVDQPVFATPILIDGDTVVSQTGAVARYLGQKHGYDVAEGLEIRAAQLEHNAADIWREVYVGRKDQNQVFFDERFPRWIKLLDNSFAGPPGHEFIMSAGQPTYLDFLVLNLVTLADYCWGAPAMAQIRGQVRLGPWVDRMLARPRIKAYFDNPKSLAVGYEAVRAVA